MSTARKTEGKLWLGHPRQLARLFSIEAWERFAAYGMRALLVLYLSYHFLIGAEANSLVGAYFSLAYMTPLIGGWLADRYLGSKRSVKCGAILMAVGYFLLCFGGEPAKPYVMIDGARYDVTESHGGSLMHPRAKTQTISRDGQILRIRGLADGSVDLVTPDGTVAQTVPEARFRADGERSQFHLLLMLVGLSFTAVGNGFFKPNISTIVGTLYAPGDRRRDAGFTIFYWGINIGSIGSQLLCPLVVDWFGWWAGFLVVGVGMLISYLLLAFDGGQLAGYGEPPQRQGANRTIPILLASLMAVALLTLMFANVMHAPEGAVSAGLAGYFWALPLLAKLLFLTFLLAVVGLPLWALRSGTRMEAQMMLAAIILIVFNVAFWTLSEQAATSLTLFAERNTTLTLFGLSVSAAQMQNVNPISIILFAPLMGWLWLKLASRGWEPSIQLKFGIALILVGSSFLLLAASGSFANGQYRVSVWWLVLSYFLGAIAELCISPVGLSMITKLAMARLVGVMMGVWFLSMSVADYIAGAIAEAAATATIGGQVLNPQLSLQNYLESFMIGGLWTVAAGALLIVISPLLKRLMHGVS
jgi:proton-dependent oligopeptide transporter, POT family